MDKHPYSDLPAFTRLMLLVAAIAQNPGIASSSEASAAGVDPMDLLQDAISKLAAAQSIEYEPKSAATLRKDLAALRGYGIIPSATWLRSGYYLGLSPAKPRPLRRSVPYKSALSDSEIIDLKAQGLTYQAISERAGVSKARIGQIINKYLTITER